VDCKIIATGIINACNKTGLELPLVVRLKGANMEAARELLAKSGLDIKAFDELDDAAGAVVQFVN
jgi:succinyl-CoA synthetase beta subunit